MEISKDYESRETVVPKSKFEELNHQLLKRISTKQDDAIFA